ncbi:MAG TPA: TatD family hydrolase [Candidatus Hydrogenedentes bacterium]|nr:TatD family hydrolase [Candidatus Hydrogenedentota bacterium]HOL77349.1 TatD family hydrolase [Candidatus Hydrogenedentota bacterium]HPO84833.1 TatD family hydrolase [Candidatus Hydrogenedentota bacterium]
MRLVDAHCHLSCAEFRHNESRIVEDAKRVGIVGMISAATKREEWEEVFHLARRFPEVYAAWGVHPWYVTPEDVTEIAALQTAQVNGITAIGEIGLDRKISTPPFKLQLEVFEEQLKIARELNLPVVVHCRGAFNTLIDSVRQIGLPKAGGIVHAYSGSLEITEELIKLGFSFSMGRALTYRNSPKRVEVLKRIYPERFLLETDSPDLPPVELQGMVNVPANLTYMLRASAELLELPEEEIAEKTTENAIRLFGLNA